MPEAARHVMPFIVGSPRSGTTLLRFMLDAHSDLAIPPETGFVGHIAGNEKLAGLGPEELLRIMTQLPARGSGVVATSAWPRRRCVVPSWI